MEEKKFENLKMANTHTYPKKKNRFHIPMEIIVHRLEKNKKPASPIIPMDFFSHFVSIEKKTYIWSRSEANINLMMKKHKTF